MSNPIGLDSRELNTIAVLNGKILFHGADGRLWTSNGTPSGTSGLNVSGASSVGLSPNWITPINSTSALFEGYDSNNAQGLWVTDGTAGGTRELVALTLSDIVALNGVALFEGQIPGDTGLWVSNGTPGGTFELNGVAGASPLGLLHDTAGNQGIRGELTSYNGKLFFEGVDSSGNYGLWSTDGTVAGTHEITGIPGASANGIFGHQGGSGSLDASFVVYGGRLIFEGYNAQGVAGMWSSDGTAAGTVKVTGVTFTSPAAITLPDPPINDPLVDSAYYYRLYPDVAAAGIPAANHYYQYGWHEGRNPDAFFNTNAYERTNPDIAAAGINPLQHYEQYGWKEGRDPSAAFSTSLYLLHNPDVKAAGIDPLQHYLQYGKAEGRAAPAAIGHGGEIGDFDPHFYLLANPDVAAAVPKGTDAATFAFQHYETYGWKEGRDPNAFFSTSGYLNAYKDVKAAGMNPLDHYEMYGWKEGRDPSPQFDTHQYLAHYTDVAAAHLDPLQHYLDYGAWENRLTFGDGKFG
jgi:ELWxxDGT repeat protein